ncbi:MAG TPA: ATP-dependent DNA ligase [Alphaproteobacteria bacterium]|nr:ATP-dependent DNA ligase [Alphaproteobacteria bacterium]
MEARSVDALPAGAVWRYEPKWDGFRCLLVRQGVRVLMISKSGQDLARYFPEIVADAGALPERHFLLDGELVVPNSGHFSFDHLLQRIHPAPSRIAKLSHETPALFIAFDLLSRGNRRLDRAQLDERRDALETFAEDNFGGTRFRLSPSSPKLSVARRWLQAAGSGSDGVIAKRRDRPYQFGNRDGMQKIKKHRSADCVIGGFRYGERRAARGKVVGSLLLGLYDDDGLLHHVGFTSALKEADKPALTDMLEAEITDASFTGNAPGGPSRWSTRRSAEWVAVKPKRVVEVSYDHFTGGRFRHGTTILRWRPDKTPQQCTLVQLTQKSALPARLLRSPADRRKTG